MPLPAGHHVHPCETTTEALGSSKEDARDIGEEQ